MHQSALPEPPSARRAPEAGRVSPAPGLHWNHLALKPAPAGPSAAALLRSAPLTKLFQAPPAAPQWFLAAASAPAGTIYFIFFS